MGLDMYLKASLYVSGWEHNSDEARKLYHQVAEVTKLTPYLTSHSPSIDLKATVGYWRKANAIHAWFVKNVQEGVDECEETYVTREHLKKLRDVCQRVLTNPKLTSELPTLDGFFFGSTGYDDDYMQDLKDTVEITTKCLDMDEQFSFYYRSSW